MTMIKNIVHWIVFSSKDPKDLSLMVKGFLIGATPIIVIASGILKIPVDSVAVAQIVNLIGDFIYALFVFVGVSVSLIGAVRKVINGMKHGIAPTSTVVPVEITNPEPVVEALSVADTAA